MDKIKDRAKFGGRTKIVCTIGPATSSPEMIENLVNAGMDVARLNLSHGSFEAHADYIRTIRNVSERLGKIVAILLDLPGPKYRIGQLKESPVCIETGSRIILTTRNDIEGDARILPVNLPNLVKDIRVGDRILVADGDIELKVDIINDNEVICSVISGGLLTPEQGVVVPGMRSSLPFMTEALEQGIRFAVKAEPDYVALSFVSDAGDVISARDFMHNLGGNIPLVAKIEREDAVTNFERILNVTDYVMVARGDLGVEIPLEKVPVVQKEIIRKCNRAGKPVITATEMLESMITSPRPTRAETTDVANAIFDGTDAIMLSAETAIGKFPVQAVEMMSRIALEAEEALPYNQILTERGNWVLAETDELISYNACHTADKLKAAAIVAFTQSGSTARRVSKYRPKSPILALTQDRAVSGRLVLCWGVYPVQAPLSTTTDNLFAMASSYAKAAGLVDPGDLIVITAGLPIGHPGTTNMLKVERIS